MAETIQFTPEDVNILLPNTTPKMTGGGGGGSPPPGGPDDPNKTKDINLGPELEQDDPNKVEGPSGDGEDPGGPPPEEDPDAPPPPPQEPSSGKPDPNAKPEEPKGPVTPDEAQEIADTLKKKVDDLAKNPDQLDKEEHADDPYKSDPGKDNPMQERAGDSESQDEISGQINDKIDDPGNLAEDKLKDIARTTPNTNPDQVDEVIQSDEKDGRLSATVDLDLRGIKLKTKGNWKQLFQKLLLNALGSQDVWMPDMPSRKIKGVFGRELEEPAIKRIAMVLDASGSMTIDMYTKALKATQDIIKKAKLRRVAVDIIVFAGEAVYKFQSRYNKAGVEEFFAAASGSIMGGTAGIPLMNTMKAKLKRNNDAIIIFSDFEFTDRASDGSVLKPYLKKWWPRLIYCAVQTTKDKMKRNMASADPQYKKKTVYLS